jgi:hypothetical protein
MDQLLEDVSKPFFATLAKWIFSGDLHDPYQEFFVQLNPDPTLRQNQPSSYGDEGFEGGLEGAGAGVGKEIRLCAKHGAGIHFRRLWQKGMSHSTLLTDLFHWTQSQLYPIQLPRLGMDRDAGTACDGAQV